MTGDSFLELLEALDIDYSYLSGDDAKMEKTWEGLLLVDTGAVDCRAERVAKGMVLLPETRGLLDMMEEWNRKNPASRRC